MRPLNLKAHNFRGFGSKEASINLDADLTLFYGPNGYGKTSLAEAIEWLFYGTTKRRERGESFSRVEYADSYGNVHGGVPVEVSVLARLPNGVEHVLSRRLERETESSITYIDSAPADFANLGIVAADAIYPVITQHSLQSFIHTKPKERRDIMSEALGLQELSSLKTGLDGARRSFQATPPSGVVDARKAINSWAAGLAYHTETAQMAKRWQQLSPAVLLPGDEATVIKHAQILVDSSSEDVEEVLPLLRTKRLETSKALFDLSTIAPPTNISGEALKEAQNTNNATETSLFQAVADVLAVRVTATSRELLTFWEAGLKLTAEQNICPMCEEPTLTEIRVANLRQRLLTNGAFMKANLALTNSIDRSRRSLDQLHTVLLRHRIAGLKEPDYQFLRGLLVGFEVQLEAFYSRHDALLAAFSAFEAARKEFQATLDTLPAALLESEQPTQVLDRTKTLSQTTVAALTVVLDSSREYTHHWRDFEQELSRRIASTSIIAFIDSVGKALKNRQHLYTVARYDEILAKSKALMQLTEITLQQKQDEVLIVRGAEVAEIYSKLNPSADVGFASMEPGTDQLKLHAQSFGKKMSAAANLSQCQLNCLGLAVWLMQAVTPESPFRFIVLDDSVQSMDDDHCEAFISSLVPFLIDEHQKQLLVLSHLKNVIDRIRELNSHRSLRLYHFESYSVPGPDIVEQAELQKRLAEIRGLSKGNEANRALAVDRLRVLVEQFIRAVHFSVTGQPAGSAYDKAPTAQLLQLFRQIPGTTNSDYIALKDTAGFADPSHHAEPGYSPPQNTNIQPHIDRMVNLIKAHNLS